MKNVTKCDKQSSWLHRLVRLVRPFNYAPITGWIPLSERLPKKGQKVITHHRLHRVDMLTFDGENFNFPVTCPVDRNGNPIGGTSRYPMEVITHWMPLPAMPNASSEPCPPPANQSPNNHE